MQQRFVRARSSKIPIQTGIGLPYTLKGESKPTSFALGYRKNFGTSYYGFSLSAETERYKNTTSIYDNILGLYNKSVFVNRTYGATIFGGVSLRDGYYAKGSAFAGYQHSRYKNWGMYIGSQKVTWLTLDPGSDGGGVFGASAEFGKAMWITPSLTVTPHIGADYSYQPDYDYWDFIATDRQNHYFEIPLGIRLEKSVTAGIWNLKSTADVTAVGSIGRKDVWNTGYSSRTGDEWRTYGIGGGHYGVRLKAGLEAVRCDRLTLGIDYTYEGRKRYYDHRIAIQAGLSF